jgi:hypothetical protein
VPVIEPVFLNTRFLQRPRAQDRPEGLFLVID